MNGHQTNLSVQSDEIEEFTERTPLLRSRPTWGPIHTLFLVLLLLILLLGSTIGIYLLFTEDEEWREPNIYNLISRQEWHASPPSSPLPQLQPPVSKILFYPMDIIGSSTIENGTSKLLGQLQLEHMAEWNEPDIAFNFILAENGLIYEGRSWDNQTSFPNFTHKNVISFAFLGKIDIDSPPTLRQLESAKLLLDVAVMEGKLIPCYNIMVWGEIRSFIDAASQFQPDLDNCEDNP